MKVRSHVHVTDLGDVRPEGATRIHFTCAGELTTHLRNVHGNVIRIGDTASGEHEGEQILLRCTTIEPPHGAMWSGDSWTQEDAAAAIQAADLVVVLQ